MKSSLRDNLINLFARMRYGLAKITKTIGEACRLSDTLLKWISWGALFFIFLFILGYLLFLSGTISILAVLPAALMIISMPLLAGGIARLAQWLVPKLPLKATWLVVTGIAVILFFSKTSTKGAILQILYFVFTFIFIFGALSNMVHGRWNSLRKIQKLSTVFFFAIGIANLCILVYFLLYPGPEAKIVKDFSLEAAHQPEHISLPDPGQMGSTTFSTFTYGSGSDRHRNEFKDELLLVSQKVDGSSFISDWDKLPGKVRTQYWGFGPDSLPLNGRVWMPEGEGPFPVSLVVHGNHTDRDFSDTGYAYIGKHLASHGILTVSVDENFLNSGVFDLKHPLKSENDARGWLLLKHLEQIRLWNADSSTVFYRKADLDNVILIGHSRGGEAVCIAASFNNLSYYPDNAKECFDFGFGIKGLVSIAQVDGQYKPSDKPTPLENINYLAFQGSMDADLTTYIGLQQMNRIRFTDSLYHFRTGLYIRNANHGQFNTSWGKNDIGYPRGLLLNRKAMLKKEEQERIALVYIHAFVRTCLDEDSEYTELFRDYRTGKEWLPGTLYFNQFQDNRANLLADFEEDIDLESGSDENVHITFNFLSKIYEKKVPLRWGSSGSTAVFIGWNNEKDSVPGNYILEFDDPINLESKALGSLIFDVIPLMEDPGERPGAETEDPSDSIDIVAMNDASDSLPGNEKTEESDEEKEVSFLVSLIDTDGDSATLSLGDYVPLNYVTNDNVYKLSQLGKDRGADKVPRSVGIELSEFRDKNPAFDNELKKVVFIFSEGEKGMLVLDNIGFSCQE